MLRDINAYVDILHLAPHPEGGWYRETYRSDGMHEAGYDEFPFGRNYCTAIYFLLTSDNFSAFHRIRSDETWHFYDGDPLEVIEIDTAGILRITKVGKKIHEGHTFQYTVKAGSWFASRVTDSGSFSLVGCTVSPGFDFRDFEMAQRENLTKLYPEYTAIINLLTR